MTAESEQHNKRCKDGACFKDGLTNNTSAQELQSLEVYLLIDIVVRN